MTTIRDTYGHEHTIPGPYSTITEIKKANRNAGQYWFSKDTLRFFDSRVEPKVYGGRLFISSEQFHGSDGYSDPRKYTIRLCDDEGHIQTVGDFQDHDDLEEVKEAIQGILAQAGVS